MDFVQQVQSIMDGFRWIGFVCTLFFVHYRTCGLNLGQQLTFSKTWCFIVIQISEQLLSNDKIIDIQHPERQARDAVERHQLCILAHSRDVVFSTR